MLAIDRPTTVGDLIDAGLVTPAEVDAVVARYIATEAEGPMQLGERYTINVAGAVAASRWAQSVMARDDVSPMVQNGAVREAVLLARPVVKLI